MILLLPRHQQQCAQVFEGYWFDTSCLAGYSRCLCEFGSTHGPVYKAWLDDGVVKWRAPYWRDVYIIFGTAAVLSLLPMVRFGLMARFRFLDPTQDFISKIGFRIYAVSFSFGWTLFVFGLAPILLVPFGVRADPLIGSMLAYWVLWPFGIVGMLLGVNVRDRNTVRCLIFTILVLNISFVLLLLRLTLTHAYPPSCLGVLRT